MKMMIYGCEPSRSERTLRVLSGGYDEKRGRAVLVVQDADGFGGIVEFDASEARDVAGMLTKGLPEFKTVGNGAGKESPVSIKTVSGLEAPPSLGSTK